MLFKLQFHKPTICNGKKLVSISKTIHNQGLALWEDCLIGQFYGPSPRIGHVHAVVNKQCDVLPLDSGGFLFKFVKTQTFCWVLEGYMRKIPIWVKLRKFPLELSTSA